MPVAHHGGRDNAEPALRRPARRCGRPRAGAPPVARQEPIDHDDPAYRTRGRPRCATGDAGAHAGDRHAAARVRGQGAGRRGHLQHRLPRPGTTRCSARSRSRSTCRRRWSGASRARPTSSSPPTATSSAVRAGLKSFVNEARLLARFDHPSLVKVYRFWEENGTAYMVMPYYEGPTLKAALAELGHVPSEARAAHLAEADPQRRDAAARRRASGTRTSAPTRSC